MAEIKLWVGCDHAGFTLKQDLMRKFPQFEWHDQGTFNEDSVDYPDFAQKVVDALKSETQRENTFGVLICGSGQGMVMKANRSPWIRAALCWNEEVARLARAHNNANVLCLASRLIDTAINEKILATFVSSPFEGGRHQRRVDKI
jgi:ribose 5-phosphate isomerase B